MKLAQRFDTSTKLDIELQKLSVIWNINGYQYMIYNSNYLHTGIPSKVTKPIIQNAGAFYSQPRSVSIFTVQAPTELKPQHIYKLNTSDDLLDGVIPLPVDKVNHKYPKFLSIHLLNKSYNRVYIPRSTVFGTLKLLDIENAEVSEISWTKLEILHEIP